MKHEYIVDTEFLNQRGLQLSDYALDSTLCTAIVQLALDLCITRISYLDDSIKGEKAVEEYLDKNADKVDAFKKLQYRVLYNMIFQNETSPTDAFVDNIIVYEVGLGKINGWQKGIYYKHN